MRTAFHDLPALAFPVTFELLDAATREVRWEATVAGPGGLRIPSMYEINDGKPMIARVIYADGTAHEERPP